MFWIIIVAVLIFLGVRKLFTPYGPKGGSDEERVFDIIRVCKVPPNPTVYFHSNAKYVMVTDTHLFAQIEGSDYTRRDIRIPLPDIQSINIIHSNVSSYGKIWRDIRIYLYGRSDYTSIRLPMKECEELYTAVEQAKVVLANA